MRIKGFLLAVLLLMVTSPAFSQTTDDFFNSNVLHEIRLEIRPNEWTKLKENFLDNTYYAADFHWFFNGKEKIEEQVGIRSRGLGSRSGVKPGLRVDFNRYDFNNRFLGLKSFVLRNNSQDASMIHERISMEFLRRMGIPAPRVAHTKLYVNDDYVGLYTIVEAVDNDFLTHSFGENGGYLYSYQYTDPFLFEYRGADPAKYSPIPFSPENNSSKPDAAPIEAMVRTVNQSTDAQFASAVSQYIKMPEFLTEIAVENFLVEQDGLLGNYGMNNLYLYRFQNKVLSQFIPWDKSNTFFQTDWPIMHNINSNVLSRRAMLVPEYLAAYRDALQRAADLAGGTGGWLEQEITKAYDQIKQAAYDDKNKLCDPGATGTLKPCSNDQFDADINFMLKFARERGKAVVAELNPSAPPRPYTISNFGGTSMTASAATSELKVGYARILPNTGSTTPSGLAIFGYRSGNVLVSEAGVPASPLIRAGRIYAEVAGSVNTGLAIANPNDQAATITYFFTSADGTNFGQGTTTIPANGQIAKFLNEAPFSGGSAVNGTFTFTSSVSVAAIALRGFTNERGEFLVTTLPVVETTALTGTVYFPHFADGGGWATQLVLVNPTDVAISGTLQFFSQGSGTTAAQAVSITANSQTATTFNYSIPARSSFRLRTAATGSAITVGSVRVTPAAGSSSPSGVIVFSFRNGGVTVTEAGVPSARQSSALRLYVQGSGNFAAGAIGSFQTGLAVTNPTNAPVTVNLTMTRLDGTSMGVTGSLTLPAGGQQALFLNQIQGFASLPQAVEGILRISAPSAIAVAGLRGRYNERGDFLITTTPPVGEDEPSTSAEMLFPHIVEGGGYTTQFTLFSGKAGQSAAGTMLFLNQFGQTLTLTLP